MLFVNLDIQTMENPRIEALFSNLKKIIPQIPELRALISSATKKGKINITFAPKEEVPSLASWNGFKRRILLSDALTPMGIIGTLIFELCNANNAEFQGTMDMGRFTDREAFARRMELSEYYGTHVPFYKIIQTILHNKTYVDLLAKAGIIITEKDIKEFDANWDCPDFETWWGIQNMPLKGKVFSHADLYRKEFDQYIKLMGDLTSSRDILDDLKQDISREVPTDGLNLALEAKSTIVPARAYSICAPSKLAAKNEYDDTLPRDLSLSKIQIPQRK